MGFLRFPLPSARGGPVGDSNRNSTPRGPPPRAPPVAAPSHRPDHARGERAAVPRRAAHLEQLDGAPACRNRRGVPGEGDGVPGRDGRARPVPPAVPRVRIAGAAYPLRRERGELLCHLPDGRPAARGPIPVADPEAGLAALARLDSTMLFVLDNYDSFSYKLV